MLNLIVKLEDEKGRVITKMDFNDFCKEATASDTSCGFTAPSMRRLKASFNDFIRDEVSRILGSEGRKW